VSTVNPPIDKSAIDKPQIDADKTASDLLVIDSSRIGQELSNYDQMWQLQRDLHKAVVDGTSPDTILLVEHEPVYTAGRRTEPFERPIDGTPVVDVDRGGKITWHGPGQLVGYPIVHLPAALDVIPHVRRLEQVIIQTCADFGLATERIKGRSGVWVVDGTVDRKIAAIGVRVAQGVAMHGFALNCNNDLGWFERIVPCGISDASVTTLSKELGRDVSIQEVLPIIERYLHEVFAPLVPNPSQSN
jgi:lipoyl(octanoyl) transferase